MTGSAADGADRAPDRGGERTEDDLTIGRIGPPRGVRGELFVEPWTDAPEERFAPGVVLRTHPAERGPLTVETMSTGGGRLVLRFIGVADRPAAVALRGTRLVIAPGERPALTDAEEFYDSELVGLAARTVGGDELGPVTDVLHAGGATYLVVRVGEAERLVPFVTALVPTVDITAGVVEIDPPPGLFEL